MTTIINASPTNGLVQTADGSGVLKVQSNGVTTNALAWVNFNGAATPVIRSSYNVSSVTYISTGRYQVNMTTALADANYAGFVTGSAASSGGTDNYQMIATTGSTTTTYGSHTTTALGVNFYGVGVGATNVESVQVVIFGN
jgi:hypothetical protein